MTILNSGVPDLTSLQLGLSSALEYEGLLNGKLTVIARQLNIHTSTYPSEVVTCRIGAGDEFQLFCKYSTDWIDGEYGHRGGIEYEVEVYRQLLNKSDLSVARFIGEYQHAHQDQRWLCLEYLKDSTRITSSLDSTAPLKAARWLGAFHAYSSTVMKNPSLSFISRYSAEYYEGWASRILEQVRKCGAKYKWVETICSSFDVVVSELTAIPATIIHGEYFPKNVLFKDGIVYPVDWESTAIGPGEIDILALIDGWDREVSRELLLEYQRARWPESPPHEFNKNISAASIYFQFRWLCDHDQRFPSYQWRLDALRRSACHMGLL